MVLLEEYYELQEAESVSRFWKTAQILLYVSAAGFGIWCGFTLALLRIVFDNKCFLFAKILSDGDTETGELRFAEPEYIYEDSIWSQETICEYCQYSMVSSFIFATIWATFFLMCGRGGKSATGLVLPQPWRIALPAMIFNFIYFLIAFAAALQIQQGSDVFCEKTLGFIEEGPIGKCTTLMVYEKAKADNILIRMEIAIKTSWLTAISWFLAFLVPLLRILFVSDFNLYKISVYKVDDFNNQNEEVVKIVDYDEGKHVHFAAKPKELGKHLHED